MGDLQKTLITKYDAIMAVKKYLDDENRIQGQEPIERHNRWRAEAILKDVPTADRPQGEWTEREVFRSDDNDTSNPIIDDWQSAKCSVCGKYHTTPYLYYFDNFNFCPHCGARMKGERVDV